MKKISKVLIANRGEIACRILRTLDLMNIPAALVYHQVDSESLAVREASETIEIQGNTPVAAYLDMEMIIEACKKVGANAVHPGFGFLAENAEFARRVAEEDIIFIGPLPDTIDLMGNKVSARSFCIENNFPIAPSVTEGDSNDEFLNSAREIGVPLLIKAASGGGGKGMQIVEEITNLEQAVELAKGEALRSFGNSEVYAERYVEDPRHIEVQIIADHHGNIVHLGERECSIQRRFQKIIEESPAVGLSPELRQSICSMAVEIARKAGYRNAGTVEFILAPDDNFYFLEMNTRLQVEHPVTEMVTGIDLVEFQIRIAMDEPLPITQEDMKINGHAIELRIYAEDCENDFLPATGELLSYQLPSIPGVRVENGFVEGMKITSAFDPMLAKIIVLGNDRKKAIESGLNALEETLILGVTTNGDFLARILSSTAYKEGLINTGFITRYGEELKPQPLNNEQLNFLLTAAALSSREFTDQAFKVPELYEYIGDWRN